MYVYVTPAKDHIGVDNKKPNYNDLQTTILAIIKRIEPTKSNAFFIFDPN